MRMVRVPPLQRDVSAIGFGCASLGSRISAADGRRAIACALDLGLSWFDVAPPYGDGNAESLLGQALKGRRNKVAICTKFGIAPPNVSLPARLVRPLARRAVAAFPALRQAASRARPTGQRAPIDPAAIEASVIRSLRMLCTDYIDVLALHEPTPQDATNAAIFEISRRLVEKGMVRAISIAGDQDSIKAGVLTGEPIAFAQFPDTPLTDVAARLGATLPSPAPVLVTHGVFGSGVTEALAGLDAPRRARLSAVAERHGIDISKSSNDLLLRFAFSNNPDGVVIISMFNPKHIEHNIAAAGLPPIPGFAAAIRAALA
jgi:aryl-alcohol dehydrogenase-like predicted oxidoreductase